MAISRLHELSERGQSVWIDSISREWLREGFLAKLMRDDAVVGVTSNPTIFQKSLAEGDWYDDQLKQLLARSESASADSEHAQTGLAEEDEPKEIFYRLAVEDIQDACDELRKVWDEGRGKDGYVSMEVDPTLAYDREATIAEALRLHEWIDKPNLFVKIPATEPGLGAIEECIAQGRSINVTLIFGLDRYAAVAESYIRGLERLVEGGGDPAPVVSVASFFVSRVDSEADKRLDAVGAPELKGKLAIANAKLAYQRYQELFSGPRWEALAAKGATPQRCLWASTSTKNPDYPDTLYVDELIGPATVNTMPLETIEAFQDHGTVADTLEAGLDEARELFAELERVGVDYDDVTDTLEREGVQKFSDSFEELLEGIKAKRRELAPA
jgi:transaldolase